MEVRRSPKGGRLPPKCLCICLKKVPTQLIIFIIPFFFPSLFWFVTAIVRVIRFFISPGRLRKLFSWSELDAFFPFHFDQRVLWKYSHNF